MLGEVCRLFSGEQWRRRPELVSDRNYSFVRYFKKRCPPKISKINPITNGTTFRWMECEIEFGNSNALVNIRYSPAPIIERLTISMFRNMLRANN